MMSQDDASLSATASSAGEPSLSGPQLQAEVMRLHYLEGLGIRAISRRLRIARKTVRRLLATDKKAKPPRASRHSLLTPYESDIERWLSETPELKASQILERLREKGYEGGITILRERVRKLRPSAPVSPYLVVHHRPGEVMQVDWADFGFALSGIPRRVSCFVAMLPFSRMMYLEFTLSQRIGSLLRCMDRAMESFGGATTADVFDNMKTVVQERVPGRPPKFNPRFLQYANARGGFAVIACTPRHPEGKGSVERGISFVRQRFWPGRRFESLQDLNAQARAWLIDWGNARHVESTGKVPSLVFENVEQRTLRAVPPVPFDTDDLDQDTVNTSCRVRFDRNIYSVPWYFVSQHVTLRGSESKLRVFLGPKCIGEHERCWGIRQDVELDCHRRQLEESRRTKPDQIAGARFGETGARYFKVLAASTKSLRREGLRLIALAELFGTPQTERAMSQVMQGGYVGADYVEHVLRKQALAPPKPLIRLGDPALDGMELSAPDLTLYDPSPEKG